MTKGKIQEIINNYLLSNIGTGIMAKEIYKLHLKSQMQLLSEIEILEDKIYKLDELETKLKELE